MGLTEFNLQTFLQRDQRVNILVQSVTESQSGDENLFEAILCKSGLPNSFEIFNGSFSMQPNQCLHIPVQIRCQPEQRSLLYNCAADPAIVAFAFVTSVNPITIHLDETSAIYSHRSAKQHCIFAIESCAGGYGGWAMASSFLKKVHKVPFIRTMAIDYDQKAIQNWLLTFGGHYVETQSTIPWQLVELTDGNLGIAADIQDHNWKQAAAVFAPNLATIRLSVHHMSVGQEPTPRKDCFQKVALS